MNHWMIAAPVGQLGLTLLHSTWELLAVAAALWCALAQTARRPPGVRYRLACAALVAAVAGPVVTFAVLAPPRLVITPAVAPSPTASMAVATPAPPVSFTPNTRWAEPANPPAWNRALPWVSAVWAVGVVVVGLWNGFGWLAVQRLRRRDVSAVGPDLERTAGRLARRLGVRRGVRLLASGRVDSPLVVGLLRPLILLPASLLTELPADQLEALLAHELAHVRRHDYAVNLLQCAAETLLFYHPAVWWIGRRMRVEREHCCDDVAVDLTGDRVRYVRALATVAEGPRRWLAPAARGAALLPRVRRLLGLPPEPRRAVPGVVVAALACAGLFGVAVVWHGRPVLATEATTRPSGEVVTVRGRVLDPTGKPVAGADVVVGFEQGDGGIVDSTRSGIDGRFVVSAPRWVVQAHAVGDGAYVYLDRNVGQAPLSVVAAAPGYGMAAMAFQVADSGRSVELKLVPDGVMIDGRLLDPQGRPVAGATVEVESIEPYLKNLARTDVAGNPRYVVVDGLAVLPKFAGHLTARATTGGDGRFRITGVGRDRTVNLSVAAPGFVSESVTVLTRPGPKVTKPVVMNVPGMRLVTYGAQFDLTMRPGRRIEGTVTDATTGRPLVGATVSVDSGVDPGSVEATTSDHDGHYRLDGLVDRDKLGQRTSLVVVPPEDQPYLQREVTLPAEPVAKLDVPLHRGVWLSGRATEAGTGRPVLGWVYYSPLKANPAADIPEFPKDRMNTNWPPEHQPYYTRPDGMFHVAVVPGPALIGIQFTDKPYRFGVGTETVHVRRTGNGHSDTVVAYFPESLNVVRQVDVPADGLAGVEFRLDPGATVRLTATDPAGRPLSGVLTDGLWAGDRGGPPQATATFDVKGLAPDEDRVVELTQPARGLGLVTFMGPEQAKAGAVLVELLPLCKVTGRLLDVHGQAMADARVDARVENPLGRYVETAGQPAGTDAAGRFTCTVPAGVEYRMAFTKGAAGTRDWWFTESEPCAVHAGQTTDIGDVRLQERELYGP